MSEERLNPELASLEAALASLAPRPAGVDRDRLMFLAGQAAAVQAAGRPQSNRRTSWLWPCATAASLLLALAAGWFTLARGPAVVERIVYVQRNASEDESLERPFPLTPNPSPARGEGSGKTELAAGTSGLAAGASTEYLKLRQRILERGLDALTEATPGVPDGKSPTAPQPSARGLLEKFLEG